MKTLEAKIREICTYHSDEGTSGYLLSEEQFQQIFELVKQAGEVAVEEYSQKVLDILDKAELEKVFDMPDSTENWKAWKGIRNSIRNLKEK